MSLVKKCASYINTEVKPKVIPGVFFIYRGVAIGGLQRNLGGFASKPLTVKYKSIDPGIIKYNQSSQPDPYLERLTGLVPIQIKLGKKGSPTDDSVISLTDQQRAYRIVKKEQVGNVKSYLCCGNTDRQLSWEKTMNPTGKTLCTFLGDTSNPYLADWDLVLVGVTKGTIKPDQIKIFNVVDQPDNRGMHNILPQWLFKCLGAQNIPLSSHVTQHGPESLYCGNDITQPDEEFIVLTNSRNERYDVTLKVINQKNVQDGQTPWAVVQTYVTENLKDYFLYQFKEFSGKESKPNEYSSAIEVLNSTIIPKP